MIGCKLLCARTYAEDHSDCPCVFLERPNELNPNINVSVVASDDSTLIDKNFPYKKKEQAIWYFKSIVEKLEDKYHVILNVRTK